MNWSARLEAFLARVVPVSAWEKLYRLSMRAVNGRADRYVTYHVRPKLARDVGTWSDPVVKPPRFAVVMQGPVAADGFTLETLRVYTRLMAGHRLILSTWDDTDAKLLDPIQAAGVDVVLSAKPAVPGIMNVNYQLTSALAGVRAAADGGADWVLKTRTDQRMYSPNLPEFLVALATTFPVAPGFPQRYRIIGLGRGTFKYLPYCVTDQTVFGHAVDMLLYWSAPHRPDGHPPGYRDVFRDVCRYHAPESYIATQYLQRLGRAVDWTIEDSWAAIADHFCLAGLGTSDLFWPKYTKLLEHDRTYSQIDTTMEIDFREWLILYAARGNKARIPALDAVLELCLRQPVPRPDATARGAGGLEDTARGAGTPR
jgi:hypothetical protein